MGWRYRKSIFVGPLRLTLGRRGVSTSVGVRGIRLSRAASGAYRVTLTLPGSGWSYVRELPPRWWHILPPAPPGGTVGVSDPPAKASPSTAAEPWWDQPGVRD